jgi:hypothetical protein
MVITSLTSQDAPPMEGKLKTVYAISRHVMTLMIMFYYSHNHYFYAVQSCPVTVAAVVSSIGVFIFTSLLFLTIGMLIGYFVHQRKFTANLKKSLPAPLDKPTAPTTTPNIPPHDHDQPTFPPPEYAPIHAKGALVEQHVQGFGMKKCEAYAVATSASQSTVNTTVSARATPGGGGGGQGSGSRPEEHTYSPVQISSGNNYVAFHT